VKHNISTVLKDCLYGLLVVAAVLGCEHLAASYLAQPPAPGSEQYAHYLNQKLLSTAVPSAVVTFIMTGLLRTKSKEAALQRGTVWTVMVALVYVTRALVTHQIPLFFGDRGVYALLLCVFTGPNLYAVIRRLEGSLLK
jgi:hypothetical protein